MKLISFQVVLRIALFLLRLNKKFKIANTKLYVSVVTLSTQDNGKPLQQLKSGFKGQLIGININ